VAPAKARPELFLCVSRIDSLEADGGEGSRSCGLSGRASRTALESSGRRAHAFADEANSVGIVNDTVEDGVVER
jgi:hypothetical protein